MQNSPKLTRCASPTRYGDTSPPPSVLSIQLLSLANNHILDYGAAGLNDTVAALDRLAIFHCGTSRKPIHTHRHEGRLYAFLGWSLVPDPTPDARKYYNVTRDSGEIVAEFRKAKSKADTIAVSLHAANEFITQPSEELQSICHELIDAGADMVLGHHPHVLQPIDSIDDGQSLPYSSSARPATPSFCRTSSASKRFARHVSCPRPLSTDVYSSTVHTLRINIASRP